MTATTRTDHEPKAWIGCLQCYNEGRLVGDWYPATEAGDITPSQLHGRPIRPDTHEELWVMDHENLPIDGECDPMTASAWGDLYDEVGDIVWPALCAYVRSGNYVAQGDSDLPVVSSLEDAYAGEWADFDEFAWSYIVDTGMQDAWPEVARTYFNFRSWANDLAMDYSVERNPSGGVFVFRSL